MTAPSGRRAFFAAGVKLGVLLAVPFAFVRPAKAQETLIDNTPTGGAELEALRQELADLKIKVDRLEQEKSTVKAPFTVVNDGNEQIFVVGINDSAQIRARIGKPVGAAVLIGLNEHGGPSVNLADSSGNIRAAMRGSETQGQLLINSDDITVRLGSTDDAKPGLFMQKDKASMIELSIEASGGALKTFAVDGTAIAEVSAAKDTPLVLYDYTGKPFFTAGLPESGNPVLTVGNTDTAHVEIGLTKGAAGAFVAMRDKAGFTRATMTVDDAEPAFSASDAGGKDYFKVGLIANSGPVNMIIGEEDKAHLQFGLFSDDSGSFVRLHNKSGAQRAQFAADETEPPIQLRNAVATPVFSVGQANGEGGPMRLIIGDEEKGHLAMGEAGGGEGGTYLFMHDAAGKVRTVVQTDQSEAFAMHDSSDNSVFAVGEGPNSGPLRLTIGEAEKEHASLGLMANPGGASLGLHDATGKQRASMNTGDDEGLGLYSSEDQPYFVVGNPKITTMKVGDPDKAFVQIGVTKAGEGTYISLYDSNQKERTSFSATADSTQMQMSDSKMDILLGSDIETKRSGLYLAKDALTFASIRFDKQEGGSMRLHNSAGNPVVGLATDAALGGKIVLAEGGSQKIVALISAEAEGGAVTLSDKSGKARAYMTASETGDLVLVGDGGSFVAHAAEQARMQILGAGDVVLVDAYATTKGLGAVATGPAGNGAAATLGNMGLAASAIIGKN